MGAACFYLATKICEKNKASAFAANSTFLKDLAKQAGESSERVVELSKKLLAFSQNYEKIHPTLKNLNSAYANELTQLAGK